MLLLNEFRLGWLLFGGGLMLLFWIALIALIAVAIRSLLHPNSGQAAATSSSNALEILKDRYARGEINKEEYDNMRRVLTT